MQAYVFASSGPWPLVLSSMGIASGAPGIESGGAFSGTNHDFACSMCLEELF
jgi:hypothetical protein